MDVARDMSMAKAFFGRDQHRPVVESEEAVERFIGVVVKGK